MTSSKTSLGHHDAIATLAVSDLAAARQFYEGVLGLEVEASEEMGVLTCRSGRSRLFVYVSEHAGTNRATAATWVVDDVEGIARSLAARGVRFERYDFPEVVHRGPVHVMGKIEAAWFADPDGNILALVNDA